MDSFCTLTGILQTCRFSLINNGCRFHYNALYFQDFSLPFSKAEHQPLPMNCSFATTDLVSPIAETNVFGGRNIFA